MASKYKWFIGGALTIVCWPIIKAVLYVVLATLAALFGALTQVTTPVLKPLEIVQPTTTSSSQQTPLTNDRLLAELRQDRQQDRKEQGQRDDGQDQAIKEVRTSVDQLRTSVDNLGHAPPPTPSSVPPPCSANCGGGTYMNIPQR